MRGRARRSMPSGPEPASLREKVRALREARRAVALVWGGAPGLTVANAALAVFLSLLPLAGLVLLRRLLDEMAQGMRSGTVDLRAVFWTIGWMTAAAVGSSAGRSIAALVSDLQSLEVADGMKSILHSKSIEMD